MSKRLLEDFIVLVEQRLLYLSLIKKYKMNETQALEDENATLLFLSEVNNHKLTPLKT